MKGANLSANELEIQKNFDISVQLVKSLPQSSSFSPSHAEATKIYGYFKQAKFGPCSIPRPGFWDVVNRVKWDSWSALGDMSADVAMVNYVEEIKKVYSRIKQLEVFDERVLEFADVLVPFCLATGAEMSEKLAMFVKSQASGDTATCDEQEAPQTMTNGSSCNKDDLPLQNGDIAECNGSEENGLSHLSSGDEIVVTKIPKTVKFQENDDDVTKNGDVDQTTNEITAIATNGETSTTPPCNDMDQEKEEGEYEKEDGELSTTEDDEEIYCDSLTPDQIAATSQQQQQISFKDHPIQHINGVDDLAVVTANPPMSTSNGFLNTSPSQNVLQVCSDLPSRSSSNNSKSEFELVNIPKEAFEQVNANDTVVEVSSLPSSQSVATSQHHQNSSVKYRHQKAQPTAEPLESQCHCGVNIRRKRDKEPRQTSSGHGTHKRHNGSRDRRNDSKSPSPRRRHHHHHNNNSSSSGHRRNYSGNSDGSSNSHSDSGTSTSSSSSDNVGLKIVKALERMDDNMHLILKRLDSIDNSMKILAEQPPPPWWVQYVPSRTIVLSTLWPFLLQLIVFYFWRRRRRRKMQECAKSLVVASFPHTT